TNRLAENERLLEHGLDERGKELLATVTRLTALNEELKRLAYTDSLTGLYNHRSFQQRLREELAQAKRYGYPCSLVVLDIDAFKLHNDRWGHLAGDEVLRAIGRLLLGQLPGGYSARESDVAARYGGEEFALFLPHTNKDGALIKAERVRRCIESWRVAEISE